MRIPLAVLLLPTLLTPAAHADERTIAIIPMFSQQVVLREPPGWEISYLYEDHTTSLAKFVPPDQTLFDWAEMLTIEAYKGLAAQSRYGPETMLKAIQREYADHCSETPTSTPLDPVFINGYANTVMLLTCPQLTEDFDGSLANETTTGLFITIKGREDFYVVHYGVRSAHPGSAQRAITADNYRDHLDLFAPLLLCDTGDSFETCSLHRGTPQASSSELSPQSGR